MKKALIRSLVVCASVLVLSFSVNAQKQNTASKKSDDSTGTAVVKGTGKMAVIVVGSAAKVAWGTTKFTAKHVAKPIVVKAAPTATKFALKKSAKYILPMAIKLAAL